MYIYYVYKHTHTVYILKIFKLIIFKNLYHYILYYIYNIYNIKHNIFFLNIYMYVCVIQIYIINKHSKHRLCKQKLLFWMWLITINSLTALIYIYICKCIPILKNSIFFWLLLHVRIYRDKNIIINNKISSIFVFVFLSLWSDGPELLSRGVTLSHLDRLSERHIVAARNGNVSHGLTS